MAPSDLLGGGGATWGSTSSWPSAANPTRYRARRWLAEQVEAPAAKLEDAQLVLSELLSNALLHGLAPIVARFRPTGDGLRVEVSDGTRRSLVIPVRSREVMTGRGLALVAALSDSWGVEVAADGNTAWAEVSGATA